MANPSNRGIMFASTLGPLGCTEDVITDAIGKAALKVPECSSVIDHKRYIGKALAS